ATVAAGFPVAVGCFLPKIVYDFAGATGVVPELTAAQWALPMVGGHAMLIVGYDLIRQTVLVRNSWGPRWGDGGYATIPFSVLEKASPPESLWVVGALEQDGGIMLRAPDTTSKADKLREEVRGELGRDLGNVRAGLRDRLTR
ncbi:MAG: C1 family peptidase, partial [Pseudomonadota bacterium]